MGVDTTGTRECTKNSARGQETRCPETAADPTTLLSSVLQTVRWPSRLEAAPVCRQKGTRRLKSLDVWVNETHMGSDCASK